MSLEEKHENLHSGSVKMRNASGQQGAVSKVKMSGSQKYKQTGTKATKFLASTYENSSIILMCN